MNNFSGIVDLLKSKFSRSSAAEMSWVISGQIVTVFLGFVIVKILSSMGSQDYGVYVLVLTAAAFLGIIYGPLQQGFIRFFYDYLNKHLIGQYLKIVFRYLKYLSLIFLFIVTLFIVLAPNIIELKQPILFFILTGIYIIIFKISEFFNSGLNVIRKRKENSILQGLERFFIIILLLILLYTNSLTIINVFLILNIIVSLFLFLKIYVFRKNVPVTDLTYIEEENSKIKNDLIKYSVPFLIWASATWLQLNGEKWIINEILSTSDVGIYAIMIMIVGALVVVPNNIINEFITPIVYKHYADINHQGNIRTGYSYILITIGAVIFFTIISTIITFLFGEELIIIISNKSYALYWYLLPLLCLGTGFFYTGQAQSLLGMALNKPQKYIAPKISTGIISVILNILLIENFGINGVAYSILLVGVFYIVYIYLVNKKLLKTLQKR